VVEVADRVPVPIITFQLGFCRNMPSAQYSPIPWEQIRNCCHNKQCSGSVFPIFKVYIQGVVNKDDILGTLTKKTNIAKITSVPAT
jgi:hypothetical protein